MRFAVCISIGGLRNHVREKHFEEGPSVRSRILSPGTELLSERNSCLEPHSVSPCHRWWQGLWAEDRTIHVPGVALPR